MERAGNLKQRMVAAGYGDAQVGIRGSSVTGVSSKGGDFRWTSQFSDYSDVDFFVVSDSFEQKIARYEREHGPVWADGRLRPKELARVEPRLSALLDGFGARSRGQIGRNADAIVLSRSLLDSLDNSEYVLLR